MATRSEPRLQAIAAKPASPAWWRNPDVRAVIYQVLALLLVILIGTYLVSITMHNLEVRGIRSGFGYLEHEAGFRVGETLISFTAADSYGRAIIVGLLNTLRVSIIAIVLATIIGTVVGIARLSKNWLLAKLASGYVELVRNIPLLLQLFFWYSAITGLLPAVSAAAELLPGIYLSKSGLMYPVPVESPAHLWMAIAFAVAVVASVLYSRWAKARQEATGIRPPVVRVVALLIVGLVAVAWLAGGAPTAFDAPAKSRFTYTGGASISPEFLALLLGLTIYTAGFIAEIVRSGILAVAWGQTEAASSLGLRRGLVLRLVVLPQALRVIVPPMTSQYLNITKNSSLAVAIGYPDLVSVTNTTLNQTGQAIECISIMMGIYLTISLAISLTMNWYNKRVALVER